MYFLLDEVIVPKVPIILRGDVVGLDLENIVTCERREQTVPKLIFTEDVAVIGSVEFNGLVNGYNYEQLCLFSSPDSQELAKNLVINGE